MYILEFSIKKNSISLQLKIFQIKYKTKNHFFFLESLAQILKSHKIYILLKKKKIQGPHQATTPFGRRLTSSMS